MIEISDYELIMLYQERNEMAETILFDRYIKLIKFVLAKYRSIFKSLDISFNDMFGECLELFNTCLSKYDSRKEASFNTYFKLVLNRKISKDIAKYTRMKNKDVYNTLSLDYEYESNTFQDFLAANNDEEPLNQLIMQENINKLKEFVDSNFSPLEKQVYDLMLKGTNYQQIAKNLNKNYKQITNTITRIRNKIKKMLQKNCT